MMHGVFFWKILLFQKTKRLFLCRQWDLLLLTSSSQFSQTDVSELSRRVNLFVFGSTTCSVRLKWGRGDTLTNRLTSPFLSRKFVSLPTVRDTEKSLTRAHDETLPSLLPCLFRKKNQNKRTMRMWANNKQIIVQIYKTDKMRSSRSRNKFKIISNFNPLTIT